MSFMNLADGAKVLVSCHALPAMTGNENAIAVVLPKIAANVTARGNLNASERIADSLKDANPCPLSQNLAR